MRQLLLFITFLFPLISNAQANIGGSLDEIKAFYPDKVFEVGIADDSTHYATTKFELGIFIYYFNKDGDSFLCMQVPLGASELKKQVEIYNEKYTTIEPNALWSGILENNKTLKIELSYSKVNDTWIFYYTKF